MEINLYLRTEQPDRKGACTVLLSVSWGGTRLKRNIPLKVMPEYWDDSKQRVKARVAGAFAINQVLSAVVDRLAEFGNRHRQYPSPEEVDRLIGWMQRQIRAGKPLYGDSQEPPPPEDTAPAEDEHSVEKFFVKYVRDHRATKSEGTLRKYAYLKADGTLRKRGQVLEHLLEFKPDVHWSDLTTSFINQFIEYQTLELGNSDNTAFGIVKKLRPVLEYAEVQGLPVCKDYKRFPIRNITTPRHWHPESELEQLMNARYHGTNVELAAAAYLLACFTALRVSDLKLFDPAVHVKYVTLPGRPASPVIELSHMVKTKEPLSVALSDYALDIINRYGDNPYRLMSGQSDQFYNEHIKLVGRQARIDRLVQDVTFVAGQRREKVQPMHKVMTSHTARHTFACNSVIRGMEIPYLQKIMGHKSIESTMQYVHIIDQYKHQQMLRVWSKG